MKVSLSSISFLLIASLLSITAFSTEYIFIGSGSWSDVNNWEDGLVAPGSLSQEDIVRIQGNAVVNPDCDIPSGNYDCLVPENDLYESFGTIIIEAGGSLTLKNLTQFSHSGSMVVYGTLINRTNFEGYDIGTITIWGTFKNQFWIGNQGTINIENGGAILNESGTFDNNFNNPGTIILKSGGTIHNTPPAKLELGNITNEGGTIENSSILNGEATITGNLNNSGTLAPGDSPGLYTITGNYTATNTSIHNFEVGGTTSGSYDVLNVDGTANISGTLNVSLIDGFIPATYHELPIITGTINGEFSTVNIPNSYKLVYQDNAIVLQRLTALPVTFTDIEVKKEGTAVKLIWKVESEQFVLKYDIERSNNGTSFSKIGSIPAKGLNYYDFTDSRPEPKSFYRIKNIDLDGRYQYSKIVFINNTSTVFRAFPLPVTSKLTLQHKITKTESRISIFTLDGILLKVILPAPGVQLTNIDFSSFKTGIYILKFEDGIGSCDTMKIIKN